MKGRKMTALLAAFAVFFTAACSTGGEEETENENQEKQVVNFYTWVGDAEQDYVKAMIAQYEEENPEVDIVDHYVPYGEYLSKLSTLEASGNMPEVFQLIEGKVFEWGSKGALLDLKPLFDEAGVSLEEERITDSVFSADGKVYGVGWDLITMCLFYNKEMFRENQIEFPPESADEPWTWEEFVDAAKKLTKDGNGKTPCDDGFDKDNIAVYGTVMPANWTKLLALLRTNNASFASSDGTKFGLTEPEAIEVIQGIKDLSEKEFCAPDYSIGVNLEANIPAMIMSGQVGMMIEGSWNLPNYTNEGYDIGVAQIPMFAVPANVTWSTSICMSPEAAENEAAFDFLRYATDYHNEIAATVKTGISPGAIPQTKSIYADDEGMQKWISAYTKVDAEEICYALKEIVEQENTTLGENIRLKNFNVIIENKIVPALESVWLDEKSPEEAFGAVDLSEELEGVWK